MQKNTVSSLTSLAQKIIGKDANIRTGKANIAPGVSVGLYNGPNLIESTNTKDEMFYLLHGMELEQDKDADKTIGEVIDETVNEYFQMYLEMRDDPFYIEVSKGDVRGFALHDLKMRKYKAERAVEKLTTLIDEFESNNQ